MWQRKLWQRKYLSNDLKKLLLAQFLTAMADNAILFVAVAMVLQGSLDGDWYVPAFQASFLVAFVVLAPWVGLFADNTSKPKVLMLANVIKAAGALMMLLNFEPLIAYAVVGIGAATYSPAKYGILPELANDENALMKSNSWIEGSTIVAILLGTVLGAKIADQSIFIALNMVLLVYLLSAGITMWMTQLPPAHQHVKEAVLSSFKQTIITLLKTPSVRFATCGVSLFWASAVILRLIIIAWAPATLLLTTSEDISLLTLFIALGIAIGALLAPKLIPIHKLRRTRLAAYTLGAAVLLLLLTDDLNAARVLLFLAGIAGGLFVVPINALLQEIGHQTVGSGHAVAAQHFFENIAMLLATGIYTWAVSADIQSTTSMMVLGIFIILITSIIAYKLPKDT